MTSSTQFRPGDMVTGEAVWHDNQKITGRVGLTADGTVITEAYGEDVLLVEHGDEDSPSRWYVRLSTAVKVNPTPQFKVGDRVKVNDKYVNANSRRVGRVGTVTSLGVPFITVSLEHDSGKFKPEELDLVAPSPGAITQELIGELAELKEQAESERDQLRRDVLSLTESRDFHFDRAEKLRAENAKSRRYNKGLEKQLAGQKKRVEKAKDSLVEPLGKFLYPDENNGSLYRPEFLVEEAVARLTEDKANAERFVELATALGLKQEEGELVRWGDLVQRVEGLVDNQRYGARTPGDRANADFLLRTNAAVVWPVLEEYIRGLEAGGGVKRSVAAKLQGMMARPDLYPPNKKPKPVDDGKRYVFAPNRGKRMVRRGDGSFGYWADTQFVLSGSQDPEDYIEVAP